MSKKKSLKSYVSSKISVGTSSIHGLGMFANAPIGMGEVVFIKGGHILTRSEVFTSGVIESYLPIDDQYVIGAMNQKEEDGVKLYLNHSCDPNSGVRGEITFVALRDINAGEEVTCDYAMIDNEEYEFVCRCRTKWCRGIVTGFDWKIVALQERYADHFARYLQEKIRRKPAGG